MIRTKPALAPAVLAFLGLAAHADGPVRPFDGTTLGQWDGDRAFWSVEDGAIVGRSTEASPLKASTYLAWTGDMPQDFELRCKVLITAGNSGIQYRSHRVDGRADMAGFQADLDALNSYTGILYEGLGREIMSGRGEQVEWSPSGKRVTARFAPDESLKGVMKPGQWNDYRIEARGTRVRHWINGTLMTDVTDGDASRFRRDGQLAFQLHAGPPMEVRFRDLEVTPLVEAPPASAIAVPDGFAVTLVTSAQAGQGSWVSLAFDPQGRAVVSPQGGTLTRILIPGVTPGVAATAEVRADPMPEVPGSAQGLCFLGGEFWVDSSAAGPDAGLWRLRDADGDGSFETRTRVLRWEGDGGEHGPHGVTAGPDGKIYVAVGNHTAVPAGVDRTMCANIAEDLVGERMWDPRGHAVGILAPGGTVLRIDPTTGAADVFAHGFRNHYDLAFNGDGELFTYDSDMEWDIGAPWYRAPRIVHVVRGGEYGWRSASGNLPEWCADTLPPACETDSSSPTGMLHGSAGGFPAPWRDMLFAADWTYGRILAVTLTPRGATYAGEWKPFATGRPMPVADMAWGPDGAMYVVTGGRGTQSGLYRIAPIGTPATNATAGIVARAKADAGAEARARRRALESKTDDGSDLSATLDALRSTDRWIAYAAERALERGGTAAIARVLGNPDPRARAWALLATARSGPEADVRAAVDGEFGAAAVTRAPDAWTDLIGLRALQVAVARHPGIAAKGDPLGDTIARSLLGRFESADTRVAEAALSLACAMGRAEAVAPALKRLTAARDRQDAMRWATMLRTVRDGWTDEGRRTYWAWLDAANDAAGGFSLRGFLDRIKEDAAKHVGRPAGTATPAVAAGDRPTPAPRAIGAPLHAWSVDELLAAQPGDDAPRNLARGAQVFRESMCIQCHRFGGEGGANGPDLTGAGGRFSRADLLRAIVEPNAAVSDQDRDSAITLADGSMVVGRIVSQDAATMTVSVNPLGPERETVQRSEVASIELVPTSSMPTGLLDPRTRAEVLDLLAYWEAGGRGG